MYSSAENTKYCHSWEANEERSHTILFNLLQRKDCCAPTAKDWTSTLHICHCEQRRLVRLRNPERTCQAAAEVLLKTMRFMKSLPSFHHLPDADQFFLLQSHWVPLFLLGCAQDRISFEMTDIPTTSLLRSILLHERNADTYQEKDHFPLNLAAVHNLKSCLDRLGRLELTPKEYTFLKGTILFNPDVVGLRSCEKVEELQLEAQELLQQVIQKLHPNNHERLSSVLRMAYTLHTVDQNCVTELFFRRAIGQTDLLEVLTEILFSSGLL